MGLLETIMKFGLEKYDVIFDRIRYLMKLKTVITFDFLIIMQNANGH